MNIYLELHVSGRQDEPAAQQLIVNNDSGNAIEETQKYYAVNQFKIQ